MLQWRIVHYAKFAGAELNAPLLVVFTAAYLSIVTLGVELTLLGSLPPTSTFGLPRRV